LLSEETGPHPPLFTFMCTYPSGLKDGRFDRRKSN
jgi:hypothetical protein